jgi:hypothetical protein
MKLFRHRSVLVLLAPVFVLAWLFLTDPDGGASTHIWLLRVLTALVAVSLTHWVRKALFDYPESDLQSLFSKARQDSTGAGLALVAVSIVMAAVLMLFSGQVRAQDARTFVPVAAGKLLPVLATEQRQAWPDHPMPAVLAALVEQESCISLRHSRCWNAASSLKTSREEGAGLGQITRAYRADGSVRFDSLADIRGRHPALAEWSWANVYQRPDLQLRALVLMSRDNFQGLRAVGDSMERLAFADAAYNGGMGGVANDRRACGIKAGCDPQQWFGNVEATCTKSRAALYGSRSACDINREHVTNVMLVRSRKYEGLV